MSSTITDAPPSEAISPAATGIGKEPMPLSCDQTVVAGYRSHYEAEQAIRHLAEKGVTLDKMHGHCSHCGIPRWVIISLHSLGIMLRYLLVNQV